MSAFKPRRVSGADLVAQLSDATANLPPTVPSPAVKSSERQRPPPVIQVNFKASEAFADLIAREAEKAGSTRRLFARLMRDAGFDVDDRRKREPR